MIHKDCYITLGNIVRKFDLEVLFGTPDFEKFPMFEDDINRPGLPLVGFFEYFDSERIQIIGNLETMLMSRYTPECRRESFRRLFEKKIPAVIITRGIEPFEECMEMAREYKIPVFRTQNKTSVFLSSLNSYLKMALADTITRHGTLVEVYGEGIFLQGDSGIGKSETAVELVKRGHRLISDDAVDIKKVADRTLVGSAPEIIRHYIEIRGIGVIDVCKIFGMGAVKPSERIDLIVKFENWQDDKNYDRLGLDNEKAVEMILDIPVPKLVVPVKSGRNLAVIVEVAAMNNRQKKMGFSSAQDLMDKTYDAMMI